MQAFSKACTKPVDKLFCDNKTPKVFAHLLQKGDSPVRGNVCEADKRVRGRGATPPAQSADCEIFAHKERRRGEKQSGGLFFGGNPRRGFSIILFLLCILTSETFFFYTPAQAFSKACGAEGQNPDGRPGDGDGDDLPGQALAAGRELPVAL